MQAEAHQTSFKKSIFTCCFVTGFKTRLKKLAKYWGKNQTSFLKK
jgi:hypothetical protein